MPKLRWTVRRRAAFLEALADAGNISMAARAAGLSRSHAYALKASDAGFAAAFADALETATDRMEAEARRRAIDGVEAPHFHQGKVTGSVTKYSDALLMFLLKAHRPERYRDRPSDSRDADDSLADEVSNARDALEARLANLDPQPDDGGSSGPAGEAE